MLLKSKLVPRPEELAKFNNFPVMPKLIKIYPPDYKAGIMKEATDKSVGDTLMLYDQSGYSLLCRIIEHPKPLSPARGRYNYDEKSESVEFNLLRLFNVSLNSNSHVERDLAYRLADDEDCMNFLSLPEMRQLIDLSLNGFYVDGVHTPHHRTELLQWQWQYLVTAEPAKGRVQRIYRGKNH